MSEDLDANEWRTLLTLVEEDCERLKAKGAIYTAQKMIAFHEKLQALVKKKVEP